MNSLRAYQHARQSSSPRIEMILTWYEQVMDRLSKSRQQPEHPSRKQWLTEVRLLIGGLMAGMNPEGSPLESNFYRLYEYVQHLASDPTPARLGEALDILTGLHDSFSQVREQALNLERSGELP